MGSIEVGGDSSVTWDVKADRVRRTPANPPLGIPPQSSPHGPAGKGQRQKGVDETDSGAEFTVTLKLPTGDVTHKFPIQPKTPDQIHIEWPSSASIAMTSGRMGAQKQSAKKSGKRKARKAKAKKKWPIVR
jgi:hypothetical protein